MLPGSTGERMLHGAPCSVAVVPKDYRTHADQPIRRIGVAYDDSDEARAALASAVSLARALDAELEIIGIVSTETFSTPAAMGAPGIASLRSDIERHVQDLIDKVAAEVPADVAATASRATGDPEELLTARTEKLDLLVMGSRGYGPLHAVLVGGLSERLIRHSACPVVVTPRGVERPLTALFDEPAAPTRGT